MNQELDLTNLRKIAEQATPGPWEAKPYLYGVDDDGRIRVTSPSDGGSYNLAESVLPNEAKHIATFDPQTVLALLNRISEAEAERDFRQQENKELFDKLQAVRELADVWESGALRWEDPLKVPREVSLIRDALGIQTHDPDRGNSMSGEGPSCSCGYNGTPKECWKSRRLAGEQVPLHIDKAKDAREKSFNDILDGEPLA